MRIRNESEIFSPEDIAKIEKMKNAKYVCETCLKRGNGWVNQPVAIFWNKDPANIPPGGSAWFGLFYQYYPPEFDKGTLMITNAISAVEKPINGVVAKNGDVIYSRYRHDYRKSEDGSVRIDGGRDYIRSGGFMKFVTLQIIDGDLVIK